MHDGAFEGCSRHVLRVASLVPLTPVAMPASVVGVTALHQDLPDYRRSASETAKAATERIGSRRLRPAMAVWVFQNGLRP